MPEREAHFDPTLARMFKRGDRVQKLRGPHCCEYGVVTATRIAGHSVYVRFDGEARKRPAPWALLRNLRRA